MKTFVVTMQVTVSTTVEAESERHARLIALSLPDSEQSEFDRCVVGVEDVTISGKTTKRRHGSY